MLRIPKLYTKDPDGYFVSLGKNEFADYASDSDEVSFCAINKDYTVSINGKPIDVHDCRVSAIPFNRPWPGKQRPYSQSESAGFISFSSDEAVTLRVRRNTAFESVVVRPLSKHILPSLENGEIVFTLTEHGSYVLEADGQGNALHIFFNKIKDYPQKESATYYFGAGMHFPGNIMLRDNDSVYIDEEAIVFGSLNSMGAKNIHIFGGGIIDGTFEERLTEHCYENHTKGNIRLYNCDDLVIEDVILTNSASWCVALFECNRVTIDGIKIVGQWRYNTDGIDIVNTSNITVKNSFIRSFDDTVTIKGIYDYGKAIENIRIENCTLWCGWGNTCEVGVETSAKAFGNITFSGCDIIHTSGPALTVASGNHTAVYGVTFKDINVEFQNNQLPQIIQMRDAQVYDPSGKKASPCLIYISNEQYAIRQRINDASNVIRRTSDQLGVINGVRFENIHAFCDDPNILPEIKVNCFGDKENISDITINSIYMTEEKQRDLSKFCVAFNNFDEPLLK